MQQSRFAPGKRGLHRLPAIFCGYIRGLRLEAIGQTREVTSGCEGYSSSPGEPEPRWIECDSTQVWARLRIHEAIEWKRGAKKITEGRLLFVLDPENGAVLRILFAPLEEGKTFPDMA